jgi:hypothetical protein
VRFIGGIFVRVRKRPVVVEAVQYLGGTTYAEAPDWLVEACKDGTIYLSEGKTYVKTLEGDHLANPGDYIIQGVHGELYPCKPDIFEKTYDILPD